MRIGALITAKYHSIRVPLKNLAPLGGVSLYRRTTDFLLTNQDLFEVVAFSSDKVSEFTIPSTFMPIQRPPHLCPETVTHTPIVKHAYAHMECYGGRSLDYIILFQPTNPIRVRRYLVDAINLLSSIQPDKMTTHYFDDNLAQNYIEGYPVTKSGYPPLIRSGNFYAYSRNHVFLGADKSQYKFLIPKRLGYSINVEADFGIVESMLEGE